MSPQLLWLCSSEQYSVQLLRICCFSVRHFPDLSGIVEDLSCFSEVRSFTRWYTLLLLFLFRQVSITSHKVPIQSFFCSLHCLLNPLVCFLVLFGSFCFIPLLLQISPLIKEVENISDDPGIFPAPFLPKYLTGYISHCYSIGYNHGIDVHVLFPETDECCKFPNCCRLKSACHICVTHLLKAIP